VVKVETAQLKLVDGVMPGGRRGEGPLRRPLLLTKALEGKLPHRVINKIIVRCASPRSVTRSTICSLISTLLRTARFPVLYANARAGLAKVSLEDDTQSSAACLTPRAAHSAAPGDPESTLQMLVANWDTAITLAAAIGRVFEGRLKLAMKWESSSSTARCRRLAYQAYPSQG